MSQADASDTDASDTDASDADGSADASDSSNPDAGDAGSEDASSTADDAAMSAALGTCQIEVDGAVHKYPPSSGFGGATAVKRNDELNVDCRVQSAPGVVQVIQLFTRGATTVGSHAFTASGTPSGMSVYSITDVGGTAQERYQQAADWTLELTKSDGSAVAGKATFTGKSSDGKSKDVVLLFHLKAES